MTAPRGETVVVVGAGGVIGSHLIPHLPRIVGVGRVLLVDPDRYGETNLWAQNIRRRDVGQLKVTVQRRVLREIDGTLPVDAIADAVENVPLGRLRGAVLLGAVDSKGARLTLNTIAARLGMPWIDAGVNGDQRLVRVSVYRTDLDTPCAECVWDAGDYALADTERPCLGSVAAPAPTRAPSALGALVASLQALACRRLLAGEMAPDDFGREIVVAADTHRVFATTLVRNARCRFDHRALTLLPIAPDVATVTLGDALALAGRVLGADAVELAVPGHVFATRLVCPGCQAEQSLAPYVHARLDARARACPGCRIGRQLGGFDALDCLDASQPPPVLALPLVRLGLRAGDVVRASDGRSVVHFAMGGNA